MTIIHDQTDRQSRAMGNARGACSAYALARPSKADRPVISSLRMGREQLGRRAQPCRPFYSHPHRVVLPSRMRRNRTVEPWLLCRSRPVFHSVNLISQAARNAFQASRCLNKFHRVHSAVAGFDTEQLERRTFAYVQIPLPRGNYV